MLSDENKATAERLFKINDRVVDLFVLNAIMNAVRQEEQERALNAASEYMKEQYGLGSLDHPVDRNRVIERIRQAKDKPHE